MASQYSVRVTSQFVSTEEVRRGGGGGSAQLLQPRSSSPHRRPVSSLYSNHGSSGRGSPAMPRSAYDNRASSIYPPTISPPDSPRTNDADDSSQPNVSPISTVAPSQPWLRPSSIPVLKRHPNEGSLAPPPAQSHSPSPDTRSGWRNAVKTMGRSPSPGQQRQREKDLPQIDTSPTEPTRWDTYSGEKAQNGSGKPAAASPTQHPYTGTESGFGYSAQITGGTSKPSHFLGVKLRKASDRSTPPPQQEPWRAPSGIRGASGRSAVVDPVTDKPTSGDKKHFPTPAERRARGLFQKPGSSGRTSPGPAVGLGIRSGTPTGRRTPQANEEKERSMGGLRVFTGALESVRENAANLLQGRDRSPDPPRPEASVPDSRIGEAVVNQTMRYKYRLGDSSREQSPMTPTYDRGALNHKSSEGVMRNPYIEHQTRSFTAPVSESPATYDSTNMYHIPPRKDSRPLNEMSPSDDFDAHNFTAAFHSLGLDNQPKSRFSVTTYNTSVAGSSPPETPHIPGLDDVPALPTPPQEMISILNRKRPVPSASNQFRAKPNRKPAPNGAGSSAQNSGDESSTPVIPEGPPKPVDRIKELEDRMKSLSSRKISLAQMIHELTNVVHPSSVHYDIASRDEIKKSVVRMKSEQDAVLAEIQELGIKLHRAYRKREEAEGGGGGQGLWVRRVTE